MARSAHVFVRLGALLATAAGCDVGLPQTVEQYQAAHGGSQALVSSRGDGGGVDASANNGAICPPKAVPASLAVDWTPPAELHAAACTEAELQTLVPCLVRTGQSSPECGAALQRAQATTTCLACLVPPVGAPEGPFLRASLVGVRPNLRACIARVSNDLTPNGCGHTMAHYEACLDAACGDCPDETFGSCYNVVGSTSCAGITNEAMACSESHPTQCPPPAQIADDVGGALILARLFCTR